MTWKTIYFDYGGHYTEDGEWSQTEAFMYTLVVEEPYEDTTYDVLVGKICSKVKVDETLSKLRISYTKLAGDGYRPMVITDNEDVLLYLGRWKEGDGLYSMLHVEALELVPMSQRRIGDDRSSRVIARGDEMISDGRDKSGTISLRKQSEPNLLLDNGPIEEEVVGEVEGHYDEGYDMCDGVDMTQTTEGNEIVNGIEIVKGKEIVNGEEVVKFKWADGIIMKTGQEFATKQEVQDLVEVAAHRNCFSVATKRSTKKLYVLKCGAEGCDWGLRLAKLKNSERFTLRKYTEWHTCSRVDTSTSGRKKKGTSRLVASILQTRFHGDIETPTPKSIIGLVQGDLGVKVSYATAWRGKQQAFNSMRGNPIECFQRVPAYLYMLKQANPGTVTYWQCDDDSRFKYLFIALGACIEGFKAMRKVIIMDGTHIKTVYGGTLLVAMAQDPDHHHYPLAFGVIDTAENHAGWEWFLEKLKTCIPDDHDLVFVTDRHQSIIKKVEKVYPKALHGYCIQHLTQNVKGQAHAVNKEVVGIRFRELATVYTEAEFYPLYLDFLAKYPTVFNYLTDAMFENKWARCYFPGERYNIDSTNCAESLNSVFRRARHYSLLPMLDAIIEKISEWFNNYRKISIEIPRTQKLVPRVYAELHGRIREASMLQVHELNSFLLEYEVRGRDATRFLVDLRNKRCTCRHFDIDKYPCVHAIAAAIASSKNGNAIELHELCSPYYLVSNWELAYCKTIYPVPCFSSWNIPPDIWNVELIPPEYKVEKGRNKTARIPSIGEPRRKTRSATTSTTASTSTNATTSATT